MKIWKLIAIIMAIIFAGGAVVSLIDRGDGSDGRLVAELKEPCIFNVATGTIPASEDPDGKGYEFFACEDCGEMKKITANHESGHYFRTLSDGTKLCACGATFGTEEKVLGRNNFSSINGDIFIDALDENHFLEDVDGDSTFDVWNVAAGNEQFFLRPCSNSVLKELLSTKDDVGNLIDSVTVSFDFCYTGTFEPKGEWNGGTANKYIFLNYQYNGAVMASLYFEPIDGQIKVYAEVGTDNTVTLLPEVEYTFNLVLEPATDRFYLTVEGGDISSPKVLWDQISFYVPVLSELNQIGIGRTTFYCTDGSYGLYIDDLELRYSLFGVNEEMVNEANFCNHEFKVKGIIDRDHPASEAWKKYTCKECGCWYYGH